MGIIKAHVLTEEDMLVLAASVAKYTVAGDFFALSGTLGMGKSTFARGFMRALAGDDELTVPSPTFTLMQPYDETRLAVAHVDAYRMESPDELFALDLDDYFEQGVVLMEWPEKVDEYTPEKEPAFSFPMESEFGSRLDIEITESEEGGRYVHFAPYGSWLQRMGLVLEDEIKRPVTEEGRAAFLQAQGITAKAEKLNQDCSFRQYFSVKAEGSSYVLMDAPTPIENTKAFEKAQNALAITGVRVPKIYASDHKQGYLLLEDLGTKNLGKMASDENIEAWLNVAVDALLKIANSEGVKAPYSYSAKSIWQEAKRYTDWYLPCQTKEATDVGDRADFQAMWFGLYNKYIKDFPKCFATWDFHVDNLIPCSENVSQENLALVDFQDACCAPIGFDLACLLDDRFPCDEPVKEKLITKYLEGLNVSVNKEEFMTVYHISMVHRHLKIVGLLERLERRDGRTNAKERMGEAWQKLRFFTNHPALADVKAFLEKHSPNEMKDD